MTQETTERTFTVSSPARLAVSNVRGAVRITELMPGNIRTVCAKREREYLGRKWSSHKQQQEQAEEHGRMEIV